MNRPTMKKSAAARTMSGGDAPQGAGLDTSTPPPNPPPPPASDSTPDPLSVNALLHNQLKAMRSENASVSTALSQARSQLVEAEGRWQDERRDLACAGGSDVAAARILELSRRLRHLTAELESERTRCRRLEAQAASRPAAPPQAVEQPRQEVAVAGSGDQETVPQLKDKLKDTIRRLVEARNQAQTARRELRLAERLLQQEVGDTATVQSLLTAGAGWRGRAQQIITLKAQLAELQCSAAASSVEGSTVTSTARSETRLSAADSRARSHIASLEREQRAAARHAAEQTHRMSEENAQLRQKLEAARSRAAVQARDTSQLHETTAQLKEKGCNDDEMIETLTAQLRVLETQLAESDRLAAAARHPAPLHGQQVSLLRAQLTAKDEQVARLEAELAARPESEPRARTPSPPPLAEQHLRRRCLEADFLLEAAATERTRLLKHQQDLQTCVSDLERNLDTKSSELLQEKESLVASRRNAERLQQMLGRARRPPARSTAGDEQGVLRSELDRLRVQLEQQRQMRERDLTEYEQTMEEARQIFCRGLEEAERTAVTTK